MNERSDEIEKKLQELRCKKAQLKIELSQLVQSEIDDDKTVVRIYDMSEELDNIDDEIKLLEKSNCLNDVGR